VGICVASNRNSTGHFITAAGTTVGGIREIEEETFYHKANRRFKTAVIFFFKEATNIRILS
jgi:hypothetical protein